MYELYRIVSSQDFASDAPLDPWAARYFVDHIEQVRSLRARPLWRKRLALRAVVTEHSGATGRSTGAAK